METKKLQKVLSAIASTVLDITTNKKWQIDSVKESWPEFDLDTTKKIILQIKGIKEEEIEKHFSIFEQHYNFFANISQDQIPALHELYKQLFLLCKVVDNQIEKNRGDSDQTAYSNAYKILLFFGDNKLNINKTIAKLNSYLGAFAPSTSTKQIHDLIAPASLPQNGSLVSMDKWRSFFIGKDGNGSKAVKLFALADKIETKKAETSKQEPKPTHLAPEDFKEAQKIQLELTYKRAEEDREFAKICLEYSVREDIFDRSLELNKTRKTDDNLPNVKIDGAQVTTVDEKDETINRGGYWLVKLTIDDPRAYILGAITNCCQSIGSNSERCVIDGITLQNNGFYVLLKSKKKDKPDPILSNGQINYNKYEIVGQGYAWLSRENNLVFDSWENLTPDRDDKVIVGMLQTLAKEVADTPGSSVSRVMVGIGGKTPLVYKNNPDQYSDKMKEGFQYGDSAAQALIYRAKALDDLENKLRETIPELPNGIFISQSHYDTFIDLYKNQTDLVKRYFNDQDRDRNLDQGIFSPKMLDFYRDQTITFEKLIQFPQDKLTALMSTGLINAYEAGLDIGKLILLYDNNIAKFKTMTSDNLIAAYIAGASFEKLSDLYTNNPKKFNLLTSKLALFIYHKQYFKFEDLKDLPLDKIQALTKLQAIELFIAGLLQPTDLIKLDTKNIMLLTSDLAMRTYLKLSRDTAAEILKELQDLPTEKLAALMTEAVLYGFKEHWFKPSDLTKYTVEKIMALTSEKAFRLYEENLLKYSDLQEYDVEKINTLIPQCKLALQTGISFNELSTWYDEDKTKNHEKFKVLTSKWVLAGLSKQWFTLKELQDLDITEIQALTHSDAILEAYTSEISFDIIKTLYSSERKKFLTLFGSENAKQINELSRYISISELIKLDLEKIKILMSDNALEFFAGDTDPTEDNERYALLQSRISLLLQHDAQTIGELVSYSAQDLYKQKYTTFENLCALPKDKLEYLLSTMWPQDLHDQKIITFDELSSLDLDKIKALINTCGQYRLDLSSITKYLATNELVKLTPLEIEMVLRSIRIAENFASEKSDEEQNKIIFSDLQQLFNKNKEKFKIIEKVSRCGISFKEMLDSNIDTIKTLTSPAALTLYRTKQATYQELKEFLQKDEKEFKALILPDGMYLIYESGIELQKMQKLYSNSPAKFTALTSPAAVQVYKLASEIEEKGRWQEEYIPKYSLPTPTDLINLTADEINKFTSNVAMEAYKAGFGFPVYKFLTEKNINVDVDPASNKVTLTYNGIKNIEVTPQLELTNEFITMIDDTVKDTPGKSLQM